MPVVFDALSEADSYTLPYLEEEHPRILIVDDEEVVRSLFQNYLSERYSCQTAASFDEAMIHLNQESFSLVITDNIMPGRSGVELLREIRAQFPDTVVIMVSAVGRTQRVLDVVRLGAYDYLIKPCELDVLAMSVEHALERRTLLRAARYYKQDLERRNTELKNSKAELERLQAQIVHSEKMASLGQLAAGIAHELNNPAGFIYGNMGILKDCAQGLERLLKFYEVLPVSAEVCAEIDRLKDEIDYEHTLADLNSIVADCHEGAERIRDVVNNLRIFSRLDEAEFKKVDIHEGLESTIRLLSHYYNSGHLTLNRDYARLPLVDCYAGQLNQVWMNLLVNAAQAIKERGEVRVRTEQKEQMVIVAISDTGCGISTANLKSIFNPFFTTKPVGEGTGLGLSVTYGIIERHHGSIEVESCPGKGTTFTVAIPVEARRGQSE